MTIKAMNKLISFKVQMHGEYEKKNKVELKNAKVKKKTSSFI